MVETAPKERPGEPLDGWPEEWFVRQTSCLWCGGEALQPLLDGVRDWYFAAVPGEFAILRCADCSSLVLDRRPDDAHIGAAYEGYYTRADPADEGSAGMLKRAAQIVKRAYASTRHGAQASILHRLLALIFILFPARRLEEDVLNRFLPGRSSRVLDYGCGNGDFLARAASLGHEVRGVDFDEQAIEVARKRGFHVTLAGELESEQGDETFDLITANHVVEHVVDPGALLRAFRRRLKLGGKLFIEVPDAQSRGLFRHGRFWRGLEAPRHFSLPSREALASALQQAGFEAPHFYERGFVAREGGMDLLACQARAANRQMSIGTPLSGKFANDEFITLVASAR